VATASAWVRRLISETTSAPMTSELFQVGLVSVLETTHFSIALMWSVNGSPDIPLHTGAKPS
jgi:hypothetical protein